MPDSSSRSPVQKGGSSEYGSSESVPAEGVAGLMEEALRFHESALSENTRRAYQQGWEDFKKFCEKRELPQLPATERSVALYLTERARRLAPSTLAQRLSAIQHAHDEAGEKSPTRSKAVRNVMRGIRRETDWKPREARPLLTKDIKAIVDALADTGSANGKAPGGTEARAAWLRGKRDRALILIGYAGALRRSEIASLRVEHVEDRPGGLLLTVPESKTDQEGEGQLVAIRRAGSKYCPVQAFWDWLGASEIEKGAVFRGVRRDGRIHTDGLSGRAVNNAVQRAAREAGIRGSGQGGGMKTTISGHSLRAGHVTQASMAGTPEAAIRAQSRHESRAAFDKYVRPQRLMENSSSAELGL